LERATGIQEAGQSQLHSLKDNGRKGGHKKGSENVEKEGGRDSWDIEPREKRNGWTRTIVRERWKVSWQNSMGGRKRRGRPVKKGEEGGPNPGENRPDKVSGLRRGQGLWRERDVIDG